MIKRGKKTNNNAIAIAKSALPVGPGAWWTLQKPFLSPSLITTQNMIYLYHNVWAYVGKVKVKV